jgi:hypothetical protein
MLGESNSAEAWTDGDSYIAFNVDIVKKLKSNPLKTISYLFSLLEHEIAHKGDSVDCGHDEAFYQRYHDISIQMAEERQRFMHIWLMKYTTSLEHEGKKPEGNAWRERYLIDRAGNGRMKKGLGEMVDSVTKEELEAAAPDENTSLINFINQNLNLAGINPPPPNWNDIIELARKEAMQLLEENKKYRKAEAEYIAEMMEQDNDFEDQDFELSPEEESTIKTEKQRKKLTKNFLPK